MDTKDLVAIVAGGASGLGEGCVRSFVEKSMKVAILDVDSEKGERLESEFRNRAIFCMTDIADENTVKDAIDKIIKTFGSIHVVINCAAVPTPGKVLSKEGSLSMEAFNRVMQINLTGSFNVIRWAAERMINNVPNEDGERGVIVNTSSGAAFEGQIGQVAYSASKAGLIGMMLPLAREFAEYGIRVMTIAPGLFETPMARGLPGRVRDSLFKMIPFPKRMGKPYEFAMLVCNIIENPMLNGEVIRIDAALRMNSK